MIRYFAKLFLALIFLSNMAYAGCDSSDPCAPKKEKDAWQKSLAFGLNVTSGNSDTTLVTVLGAANKETDQDLIDFNLSYSYGQDKNTENDNGDHTTRNDFRAEGAYNYKLSPLLYAGFGTKFLNDEIADIDYRVNLNPTIGYFVVKNSDLSLAFEGGPGYTFERTGGEEDDYFSPRLADRFDWVISCTSKLFQKAEIIFDTSDSKNYVVNSEIGIEAAISSSLSLVVALKDLYDNQPAEDKENNDFQMISALKVAL